MRHCHDCSYFAPAAEDWKLFYIPGVRPFANRGEYDLVMDIIRSVPIIVETDRKEWHNGGAVFDGYGAYKAKD